MRGPSRPSERRARNEARATRARLHTWTARGARRRGKCRRRRREKRVADLQRDELSSREAVGIHARLKSSKNADPYGASSPGEARLGQYHERCSRYHATRSNLAEVARHRPSHGPASRTALPRRNSKWSNGGFDPRRLTQPIRARSDSASPILTSSRCRLP